MAMPKTFKAMVVTETPEKQFLRDVKQKEISDLPAGELIIEVKYSPIPMDPFREPLGAQSKMSGSQV